MQTTAPKTPTTVSATIERLSERLADAFCTGELGDTFSDDVFFDGNPPLWRFQLRGAEQFGPWLVEYTKHHPDVSVVHTTTCDGGFITEHVSSETTPEGRMTSRKILLCRVRHERISELIVYCSGDWDNELRARHRREARLVRT